MDEFDRVSVKAIICHPSARYKWLLVQEHGTTDYTLPGGRVEKGETHLQALERELHEEVGLTIRFTAKEIYRIAYATRASRRCLWVVYLVTIPGNYEFRAGPTVQKIHFVNPRQLSNRSAATEQRIYTCYREAQF